MDCSVRADTAARSLMELGPTMSQDRGMALADIVTVAIAITLILSAGLIWLGPETRGRDFNET
jgi:hypothetical protein